MNPAQEPQAQQGISLWNLHRNLASLADELAEAAQEADIRAGNDNRDEAGAMPTTPRAYSRPCCVSAVRATVISAARCSPSRRGTSCSN